MVIAGNETKLRCLLFVAVQNPQVDMAISRRVLPEVDLCSRRGASERVVTSLLLIVLSAVSVQAAGRGTKEKTNSADLAAPRASVVRGLMESHLQAADAASEQLRKLVTIYRDRYGVPHIVGESEEATFFGFGYAQAEDHLEQMMLQYRDAQGRRTEILGREALGDGELHFIPYEYRWGGDHLQRLLRTWQCVADNKRKMDPAVYQILDAFARGVNYFIKEHRAQIPVWIDEITAVDVEALQRSNYMRFYSVDTALAKLRREPQPYLHFGSNQWAIEPQKSSTGQVIHVEHIHMPWANHFQNYEAHLITPGKLDVAGISWFGSPFFLVGFNEKITWSVTWNQPNIADAYEEVISTSNPRQYLYEGQWRHMRIDSATFRIKESNGVTKVVTLPLYYTHHGPVVRFDKDRHRAFSVKLPNFDGVNYSTGLYNLMKATSIECFRDVLARQLIPRWNFLCTDAKNVYWVHNGLVARRNPNFDWSQPVPGWTKATEWGAYLPFSSNPQLFNPQSGFVQNCNNPPWVATRNSGLKPLDPVPYYLAHAGKASDGEEVLNARGERVFGVLTRPDEKFTLKQMISMGFDTYVLAADVVVPLLEQARARREPIHDARLRDAMDALKAWNRRSSTNSYAYTYFFYWAKAYEALFSTEDLRRFTSYRRNAIDIHSFWEQRKAWRALEEAVNRVQAKFGKTRVQWGEINVVVRGAKLPVGGTNVFDVLHPDMGSEQPNGQIYCNDGWGHLMVVMEGNPKRIWSLLPYGESEHPDSRHYNDQAILHSRQEVKPFWFSPEEILANTESTWGDPTRLPKAFSGMQSNVKVRIRTHSPSNSTTMKS
jgi:acyl-homoserine-lactone acylase